MSFGDWFLIMVGLLIIVSTIFVMITDTNKIYVKTEEVSCKDQRGNLIVNSVCEMDVYDYGLGNFIFDDSITRYEE